MIFGNGPAWPRGVPSVPPRPAGWTSRGYPGVLTAGVALQTILGLGAVALGVAGIAADDLEAVVIAVPAVVVLAHLVGFGVAVRWRRRRPHANATFVPSPDGATRGVRFAYSRWMYYWFTGVIVVAGLGLAFLASAFVAGGSIFPIVTGVIFGAMALSLAWFLISMLRVGRGEVTISPVGVFHRGPSYVHFIPWYAIAGVEARWLGVPVIVVMASPSEDTRVRSYTGHFHSGELGFLPLMVIRTYWLATDPDTVYHALAFYFAHPELREELATPAALARIADGRAVSGPDT